MKRASLVAIALVPLAVGPVLAQTGPIGGWLIEVIGEPVSPSNPSTTVRVSAHFPQHLFGFYGANFRLVGSDTIATFTDIVLPAPLGPRPPGGYGCFGLFVEGGIPGGVERVRFFQEGIVGCIPHKANPLAVFEATWTTSDFRPRVVELETQNTPVFAVWVDHNGNSIDLVSRNQFRHGSAVIQVIPAPSGAAMLLAALGAGMLPHRRRG